MKTNANDNIYPISIDDGINRNILNGLTKLEHFASLIMQGFAADPQYDAPPEVIAKNAVRYANALIEELNYFQDQKEIIP